MRSDSLANPIIFPIDVHRSLVIGGVIRICSCLKILKVNMRVGQDRVLGMDVPSKGVVGDS